MDGALRARCAEALHVLEPTDQVILGAPALLYIYDRLGYGRWVAVFRFPPLSWLTGPGYRWVANHRLFFSRFAFRTPE